MFPAVVLACMAMNSSTAQHIYSGDTHLAEEDIDWSQNTSGDAHPAGVIAGFAWYNLRLQNADVYTKKKWERRLSQLLNDLQRAFGNACHRIHVLCISEFGSMVQNIDDVFQEGAEK